MQRQYTLFMLFRARLTSYLSFLFLFSNSLSALQLSSDKTNCLFNGGNFLGHRGKDIIEELGKHPRHTYKAIYYRGQSRTDSSAGRCEPWTFIFFFFFFCCAPLLSLSVEEIWKASSVSVCSRS